MARTKKETTLEEVVVNEAEAVQEVVETVEVTIESDSNTQETIEQDVVDSEAVLTEDKRIAVLQDRINKFNLKDGRYESQVAALKAKIARIKGE